MPFIISSDFLSIFLFFEKLLKINIGKTKKFDSLKLFFLDISDLKNFTFHKPYFLKEYRILKKCEIMRKILRRYAKLYSFHQEKFSFVYMNKFFTVIYSTKFLPNSPTSQPENNPVKIQMREQQIHPPQQ